ncbi:MAG: hypothetical protein J5639_09345 [Bacteroidales bacterium]|nr:hypothetical protein [Bacteroidales bacterium]
METRSNKAKKDKGSILVDVTNLLAILYPAIQKMPKIERIEGAPREMKTACYGIIRHYSVAKENPEVRMWHIRSMFGDYGVLLTAFSLCVQYGLFTDSVKLAVAVQLERIEEGIRKWRNATRSPKSEEQLQVADGPSEEAAVSIIR